LLDRRAFEQARVKFSIVAKYDPVLRCYLRYPLVVGCVIGKLELVFRIVVKLHSKGRLRRPDSFGETFAKIPIKIKR
jgi:hypothetical protein